MLKHYLKGKIPFLFLLLPFGKSVNQQNFQAIKNKRVTTRYFLTAVRLIIIW
jgi:hypothetical protein